MILIISFENNEHVELVRRHLNGNTVLVNAGWFPSRMGLDARLSNEGESVRLALPNGQHLHLADVGAVWCRRLQPYTLHPEILNETARTFALSESAEGLQGVWYATQCHWVNPPFADEISQRKIRQLQVARAVGLSIADTVVTNDPQTARNFIELHGPENVIRKAFRNLQEAPRATTKLTRDDLQIIDAVKYAPVIFQTYVPLKVDLRVTVIGDEVFAAAIHSDERYASDYREGLETAKVVPYELPVDVTEKLLRLMRAFSLQYGAVDFRVTPDGDHVFFEVNPAGEYLFISKRTGQPIPQAIAAHLERHDALARAGRSS